ncbi:MAG: hypothetical protein EBU59_13605, partial [Planctomycetia bacterium]|nr:hypothetical protein [Planctomycetia bacterium]
TGSGNISVSGDLLATNAGSESLIVNSTGVATFGGAVGNGSSSLTSYFNLFTTDAGGTAQFAGNVVSLVIALNSDVELLGNVTFAGEGGAFNGSVDGGGFGVQLGFLETAVDGARWSNLASLRFEGDGGNTIGTISLSNTITTTGLQEYNGRVVLSDNTTLVAGADGVSFLGGVDGSTSGNQSLAVNTTGPTVFGGNIGATTPLASLTTSAGGNTTIAGPSVITTGNQSYGDAVVLSGALRAAATT